MDSILIIAGENSGEKYGAALIHQFKKIHPDCIFFGIGGSSMEAEGARLLFSIDDLAIVGIIEIVSHIPRIHRIFKLVLSEVRKELPIAAVLIDSPDFNLRLAKPLKKLSIPILYYISPTVWAWRKARLKLIKKTVAKMLLIFPFEKNIYKKNNIPAEYIGHPLLERIRTSFSKANFYLKYGLDPEKQLIALLPGSRKSEIQYHMPILTDAIKKINSSFNVQFVLLLADNLNKTIITKFIPPELKQIILILKNDAYEAIAASDLALSSCGTANLEAALLETPIIAFYRLSPLTYSLGLKFIKISNYSIVNILAGHKVIPELIQNKFSSENIFHETERILISPTIRSKMIENFKKIRKILGDKNASQNAAQELDRLISSNLDYS
jgi:lipid-A-disaccharide synthase